VEGGENDSTEFTDKNEVKTKRTVVKIMLDDLAIVVVVVIIIIIIVVVDFRQFVLVVVDFCLFLTWPCSP
jgi:hypothetical protein